MAVVGPTALPDFLSDEEMAGLEQAAKLETQASMPDFIPDDEMPSYESGGWNWGDAISQTLSGAAEGIATLPAMIADLNPLDSTNTLRAAQRVAAVEKPSLWNYLKAAAPDFHYTNATQEAIDPYLAQRDPQYRYFRTAGNFVGPGLFGKGLQAIKAAPEIVTTIGNLFAPAQSVGRQVFTDLAAGGGSQLGADVTGDSVAGRFLGALFGAGTGSALTDISKTGKGVVLGASPSEIKGTAAKVIQETSGMTPGDIQASIVAAPADELGNLMTTAEITKNPGLAQLEQTMTTSGEGANRLGALRTERATLRDKILDEMTSAPSQTKEAIGTNLMKKASEIDSAMGAKAEELWEVVPRKEIIDAAPEQLNLAVLMSKKQAGLPVNSRVQTLVGQFLGGEEGKTALTSGALQDIRSDALELLRDANMTASEKRILASLQQSTDSAAKRGLSPADYNDWIAARTKTRERAETFKRGTAGGALTEEMTRPAEAPKNAFKGDSSSVQEIRKAIGNDAQLMESFKRFVLDDIPRDANELLTPAKLRNYLRRNEGGLTDLFGQDHYEQMGRILEDLQSEASVSTRANASSRGQSVTQQRLTVAGAIEEAITSGITGKSSFLGKVIQALKEGAGVKDKAAVKALLTDAVFDPEFALALSQSPTTTRILNVTERLVDAVRKGTISSGRAALLTQNPNLQDSRSSQRRLSGSSQYQGLFGSTGKLKLQANENDSKGKKEQKAKGVQPGLIEGSSPQTRRMFQESAWSTSTNRDRDLIDPSDIQETYPVSYAPKTTTQAAFDLLQQNSGGYMPDYDVESLVKAVIEQESGGRADAISPKGATGLMQLMPGTAADVARELGLSTYDLKDAATNRLMGTYYLRKMLNQFGSPELALAAYNAGPSRVQGWISKYGPSWGEISRALSKIRAYEETRNYVPQVLARLQALNDSVEV